MFRRLVFVSVAVFINVSIQTPAFAGAELSEWTDGSGVGVNNSTSPSSGSTSAGHGGKASDVTCSYVTLTPDQVAFINGNADPSTLDGGNGAGAQYNAICTDPTGNIVNVTQFALPTAPAAATLAQQAFDYRRLPLPAITLSPAVNHPQLVNLPTWLSVSPKTWTPVSASASAGGVTATTTAQPTQVVWTTGDGGTVTCAGPGATYDVTKPADQQHSDCTYTYQHSSASQANGTYTLTATVTWAVNWTATGVAPGVPASGALNPVTRTASIAVQVNEADALNQVTR